MSRRYIPDALPARFTLNPAAMETLEIRTLEFPFMEEIADFRREVEDAINGDYVAYDDKEQVTPPFRQFNNALLHCVPTLTHGFEFYTQNERMIGGTKVKRPQHRALSVGTPNNPLRLPTPKQMGDLISGWTGAWAREYEGRNSPAAEAAERLRLTTAVPPDGWDWQTVEVTDLISDVNAANALGYQAIPSLLATLLHRQTCTITRYEEGEAKTSLTLKWRKAQGLYSGDKIGLFVVSQPIEGKYYDDNDQLVKGYFAYRLDFRVETQTGRTHDSGKLKPWIFLYVSCQRYGDQSLDDSPYGRKISLLVGSSNPRKDGFPNDGTLVRLAAQKMGDKYRWYHHLPEYIGILNAEPLPDVNEILKQPTSFANLADDDNWFGLDCRLVHVEGAKYLEDAVGNDGKQIDHVIEPGYTLRERGDIVAAVLNLLKGVLIPDEPLTQDMPGPYSGQVPDAMRTHQWCMNSIENRKAPETVRVAMRTRITQGIQAATGGQRIHLALCHEKATSKEANEYFLKEALFLTQEEPLPDWLSVTAHPLESRLLELLPDAQGNEFTGAYSEKHSGWRDTIHAAFEDSCDPIRLAFSEINFARTEGVHPRRNVKGLARAAFAHHGVASQFLNAASPRSKPPARPKKNGTPYANATEYRYRNAVRDLLLRQTGALMGTPIEIYKYAKLPDYIAENLDVIAFCRRRVNKRFSNDGDIQYVVAVRLRANGMVDVFLPDAKDWIPYVQAGPLIGKLFFEHRNQRWRYGKRPLGLVKLSGAELSSFVDRVLRTVGEKPTLAVIEARGWRNGGGEDTEGRVWPQLRNTDLYNERDILKVGDKIYQRDDTQLKGLLAVVRLRDGAEVPQYIANRSNWNEQTEVRDFNEPCGYCDWNAGDILHYFSAGVLPDSAAAEQRNKHGRELYKTETVRNPYSSRRGAQDDFRAPKIAYKHPNMLEMVPFFLQEDFRKDKERTTSLCRVLHYLRISPGYAMGNTDSPFPMHLGDCLIDDQLCILGITD